MKIHLSNETSWLKGCSYEEEEEAIIYDAQLQDILENTRWYLDNLDYLPEYRVRWNNYSYKTATLPLRYVDKQKPL